MKKSTTAINPRRTALMTLQSIQHEFNLSPSTVRDLVARGHLPVVKLPENRRLFVQRQALERLLNASSQQVA
jgi:hypothetical protein